MKIPVLDLRQFIVITLGFIYSVIALDGQPLLASGGSSGIISIWNLEKRRLQSVIREAHDGSIISLHFLANEPVLMSSAADNSIKVRSLHVILFGILVYIFSIYIANASCSLVYAMSCLEVCTKVTQAGKYWRFKPGRIGYCWLPTFFSYSF